MAEKDVDFAIELEVRGKTKRTLGGEEAEIVDRAVVSALVRISQRNGKAGKTAISDHIGDHLISKEKISRRRWEDPDVPEGFSYAEAVEKALDEVKGKKDVLRTKEDKIDYIRDRIIQLREQAIRGITSK